MKDVTSRGTATILPSFAKQKLLKSPKWLVPTVLGVILVSSVAIYLLSLGSSRVPIVPPAIVVSACPDLAPGMRRITSDFGTRFDVSDRVFKVHVVAQDMPPGMLYVVKLKHADARIVVWRDDDVFRELKTAFPVFSEHVEERNIWTSKERLVGTDRWGYLKSGERWRYVRFSNGDAAGYSPTPPKEPSMLDQVVGSACLSRDAFSKVNHFLEIA